MITILIILIITFFLMLATAALAACRIAGDVDRRIERRLEDNE